MRKILPPLMIFVVALAVRLYYLAGIEAYPKFELIRNRLDDQVVFDLWAKSIVAGERFDYSTTGHDFAYWAALSPGVYPQAPLYPFFLAALYKSFGLRYDLVRIVQMLLGSTACGLLYLLARRFLRPWTAVLCGLAAAFYGPTVFYESTFLRAAVFTLVAVAGLYLLLLAAEAAEARRRPGLLPAAGIALLPAAGIALSLAAGIVLSLGVLLRPNYLLVAVPALAWLYWMRSHSAPARASARGAVALAAAGLALPLLLVVAVNSVRSGGLAFLSSNGPYIFFISNVHDARGTSTGISPYYLEVTASRPPEEIDLLGEALRDIGRHPGAFLRLQVRKALYFFAPREIPNNLSYAMARETNPRLAVAFLEFYLLLPVAAAGLLWSLRRPRRHLLLYIFLAGYWAGTVAFYVLARLRLPVVPVLLVFAGVALEAWWRTVSERRWLPAAGAAVAVLAAAALLRPPPVVHQPSDYQMAAAAHFSLAGELERDGRPQEAWRQYARVLALNPDFDRAAGRLAALGLPPPRPEPGIKALCEQGRSALAQDRFAEAVRLFERASALAPETALPYQYLSNAYYLAGEPRRAMRELERAVERDPYNDLLRQNLKQIRREMALEFFTP